MLKKLGLKRFGTSKKQKYISRDSLKNFPLFFMFLSTAPINENSHF